MNFRTRTQWALNLCLALTLGVTSNSALANQIPDPSFEATTANWTLVDSTTTFVSSPVRTGSKALSLLHTGDGVTPNTKTVWQFDAITVLPGVEYTYDVWVSGQGLTGTGSPLAIVRWKDSNGDIIDTFTGLSAQESFRFAPLGTYPFSQERMTMHLQAPARAFSADIGFRSFRENTGGTSYWDDVSMRRRTANVGQLGDRLVSYEVEDANVLTGGDLLDDHIDHSGTGYYDIDTDGAVIQWDNVIPGTNRVIGVRFSWEGNPRDIELLVNGVSQGKSTPIPTGRRGTWATHIFTGVDLPNASNTVRLIVNRTGGEKSQPLIDRLDIHEFGSQNPPASAPLNVAGSNQTFSDKVRVTWDPVIGASRYEIFRSTIAGNIGSFYGGVTGPSFDDIQADELVTYYYRIKACNDEDPDLNDTCSVLSTQVSGVRATDPSVLNASVTPTSSSTDVDLTVEGSSDWIHWGRVNNSTLDRKAGIAPIIPNFIGLNGANPQQYTNSAADYTWSDGTPGASFTTDHGLQMFDEDVGLQLRLPADQNLRTFKLYVGVNGSSGTLRVELSDGSKPPFTSTIVNTGRRARTLTVDYAAASAGQELIVEYTKNNNDGNIYWDAAAIVVPNMAPSWTPISSQTVVENQTLTVGLVATDGDGPGAPTLTQTNTLPGSPNILTDNGNGSGTINWTPAVGAAANSPYSITVTATDSLGASASQTFTVNVINNSAPVITTITDKAIVQGAALAFNVSASDPDGPTPITLTQANNLPGSPNILTDNGNGNGTIAWLSQVGDASPTPYQVTITASDGANAVSTETFNVFVTTTSPPQLSAIGDQSVIEQRTLSFPITANDSDGPFPLAFTSSSNLPGNPSVVTDNGNSSATFSYTPTVNDAGTYSVTVNVADGNGDSDTETFNIVVTPNQIPEIDPIADRNAVENQQLVVPINAIDPDGPLPITLTFTETLPGNANLSSNGDGTGTFSYTPTVGESNGGPYSVTITATDDDGAQDTEQFTVSVAANTAPTLSAIGDQTARELSVLSLQLNAQDADGPLPFTLTQTNTLPGNPNNLITDNGDGTGTLNWTPQAGDHIGSPYTITVTASDGENLTDSETITVTVLPQGSGGTLTGFGSTFPNAVALHLEGTADWIHMGRLSNPNNINRKAGITPLIEAFQPLPGTTPSAAANAFTDYSWQGGTPVGSDGIERTGLRAFNDGRGYSFSVPAGLSPRTLKVYLGARFSVARIDATLSDASAAPYQNLLTAPNTTAARIIEITYAAGLPGQTLDVTFQMVGAPNAGGYIGLDAATLVSNNLPPAITTIPDQNAVENQLFSLPISATDNDGPAPITFSVTANLPGAPNILTDNGDGTGSIDWTPAVNDAGTYGISLTATDGDGEVSIESFNVTVTANSAPEIVAIPDGSAIEGQLFTQAVTATDPDGPTPLVLTATSNITGNPSIFTDNSDGTGTINWTPTAGLAGGSPFTITITATDGDGLTDTESFSVSLTGSEPPTLNPIGNLTVIEQRPLSVAISATDSDGPAGFGFTDTNDIGQSIITNVNSSAGTATLFWVPPLGAAAGSPYTETVTVVDGGGTSTSETFQITVVPNQAPVLSAIGNQNVVENNSLFLNLTAADADATAPLVFTQTNTLPTSSNILIDNGDNTATIVWTAATGDADNPNNPYSVTVTVTDAFGATAVETFSVTATKSAAPVLSSIGTQNAVEQLPLTFGVSATDSDGPTPLVFSLTHNMPNSPSLVDNGDSTANFSWNPAVGDAANGPYSATITVADGGGTETSETFVVNVTPNVSPELAPIGEQTAVENVTYTLNLSATDDGANPVTFTETNNLPGSPSILTDNNDGTATISFIPDLDTNLNSPYNINITVTDENGTQDSETFVLNVVRGGRLTGSSLAASNTVDLTDLGKDDWIHWGLSDNESINRKAGVTAQITDWIPTNGATPQTSNVAQSTYIWSDGTPTGSTSTNRMVRLFSNSRGMEFTVPASRSERLVRIYVGVSSSAGLLTASLSDSSAPVFSTTISSTPKTVREISLVYRAGSPNQTLTIRWEKTSSSGWISLDGATLENLNEAPVLPIIGNQFAVENQTLSIALNATDTDGPAPITFSQSNNLPGIPNILTDNGDGTGSLDYTPSVGDSAGGPYQVTLNVEDGVGETATQVFNITVAANTPPDLTPIGDQSVLADVPLVINITSTDADGPAPITLTQTNNLPGSPVFVDNGDGTGSLSWTGVAADAANSPYSVAITATDADNMSVVENFLVNLTASLAPELGSIGNQSVIEGRLLSVPLSATDADGPLPLTFTDTNTIGQSLIVNNNELRWTPAAGNTGVFSETVVVSDAGGTSDSETISITVLSDQAPILQSIGSQTAFENAPFTLVLMASDPDGVVPVSFSQTNNLPGSPLFIDNGDGSATLTMSPVTGDSNGSPYTFNVTVTDGFGNVDQESVSISVTPSLPPIIEPIGNQTAVEEQPLQINVTVNDPDGPTPLTITETNTLPGNPSVLTDNGNGTATINWTPGAGDSFIDPFTITVTATDGAGQSSSETFQIDVSRDGLLDVSQLVNDGAVVDLTSEGVSDWIHWGLGGTPGVDRKAIAQPIISDFVPLNGANPTSSTIMDAQYTWSDGSPNASQNPTRTGLRLFTINNGVQVTVPADLAERTLIMYVGARSATAKLTATLSDGSVAPVEIQVNQTSGKTSRKVIIVYKAGTNGQNMTIAYEKTSSSGWVSLEAAALVATNSNPSIVNIGDQSATEGNPLTIALNANDDGPAPITWTETNNLPGSPDILTNFGNGVGELNWTPAVGDAPGPYAITVTATDAGGASSSETFNVSVAQNQNPTLVAIEDQVAVQGQLLTVNIVANDTDGPGFPVLTQSNTIAGNPVILTDNGDGTGSLTWTPSTGTAANSPYTVTITATDGVGNTDTTSFSVSVTASFPPVLEPIGSFTVIENRPLNAAVTANDADGNNTISLLEANSTIGQSILTDNGNGSGTLSWIPPIGAFTGSPYTLDVVAQDSGNDSDSETITITVVPNQPPSIATIGNQTATENVLFSLGISASDPDGLASPVITQTNNLPGSPVFTDNGNGSASLNWTPASGDNVGGPYTMTVTATDLDGATDTEQFQINVITSLPPVIAAIGEQNAVESNEFTLRVEATDSDGPAPIAFTQTNTLPGTLVLVDNTDGTADLSYTPAINESLNSPYSVTITATDGAGASASETFALVVNREGVITGSVAVAAATTDLTAEGESDWIKWEASSVDRKAGVSEMISTWTGFGGLTNPTLRRNLPGGLAWNDGTPTASATRNRNAANTFNQGHRFEFTAPAGIGNRVLRVYVAGRNTVGRLTATLSDGSTPAYSEDITFTGTIVSNVVTISYKSSLPGQTITIGYEKPNSGGWISLAGASLVEVNQEPTITALGDQNAIENQLLSLNVVATDVDGPLPLTLSATSTLPGNPNVLTDNGDGTGTISYTPSVGDAAGGPYSLTVTATDAAGGQGSETIAITVLENQAPILDAVSDQNLLVGQNLNLSFIANDDGPAPLTISQTNTLPSSPSFIDNGDGTASFSWTPQSSDRVGAPHSVTVTATDGEGLSDTITFSVGVTVSAPPTIASIADQSAIEGRLLVVPVSATDGDGNATLTLTASPLGNGLSFNDAGNGQGSVSYIPPLGAAANSPITVTITATDTGGDVDVETFNINVAANQAPQLTAIGSQSATEGVQLTVSIFAIDQDGLTPPSISQSNTLTGSPSFVDNGNGSAVLTWTPAAGDAGGSYSVTVVTTDSEGATDSETFSINVTASNPPELANIEDQNAIEEQLWTLTVSATDPDGPAPLTFSETNTLPGNPSILVDNNDGTAVLSYTPSLGDSLTSPFSITVTATDGAGASDTQTFALNVNREGSITHTIAVNNDPTGLTTQGENDWIHWGRSNVTSVNRKDIATPLISSWTPVNSPNLTRSVASRATYIWNDGTPEASEAGTRTGVRHFQAGRGLEFTAPAGVGLRQLNVYVTDQGGGVASRLTATLSDGSAAPRVVDITSNTRTSRVISLSYKASTSDATLTVRYEKVSGAGLWVSLDAATLVEFNQAPTIAPIGNQTVVEGQALNLNVTSTDSDGPAPITLTETNTLPGTPSVLTDNGDGTGVISWTPAVGDAANGPYAITVRAADGLGVLSSQTITINVVENQAPVLDSVGDANVLVGQTLNLTFIATDSDGPAPIGISQVNSLPTSPTFTDNLDGTASFSWTPQNADRTNGVPHQVTVTATDGDGANSSITFNLTVTASAPPVLAAIANQTIIEGRLLAVPVTATDADGNNTISLTASPALAGLGITDGGNGMGTVNYVPPLGASAGSPYQITVSATDTGGDVDIETFLITVAANQPPQLESIGNQNASENVAFTLGFSAVDADGTAPPSFTQTNTLPGSPTFNDNGNGSATLNWTPPAGSADNSPYSMEVTTTDSDGATDVESFTVTVGTSAAPIIDSIGPQVAIEDQLWSFSVNVTDPDGPAPLTLSETNDLPGSPSILVDNGDGTGVISFTPPVGSTLDSPFSITLTATDGAGVEATETFALTVNREGAITGTNTESPFNVDLTTEGTADWIHWATGNATSFTRKAGVSTPLISNWTPIGPNSTPSVIASTNARYAWSDGDPTATGNAIRRGVRTFVREHAFQFTAPASIGERQLKIFVTGSNTVGRLTASLSDGSAPDFTTDVTFTTKRSRTIDLTYKSSTPGATLTLTWSKPNSGGWISLDGAALQIFNDAPVLDVIGNQAAVENQEIAFAVTATDTDGPAPLTLSQTNTLPGNPSVLVDNGDGTGSFAWTPAVGDAANSPFTVTITATDGDFAASTEVLEITVAENQDPILSSIGPQDALENQQLLLTFIADDLDGPAPLTFSQSNNLPGAPSMTDNANGTATFTWTPPAGSSGNSTPYEVTVTVTDGDNGSTNETFEISVFKSLPPVLTVTTSAAVIEGRTLTIPLSASDADGPLPLVFSQTNTLPGNPSLTDNGNGTGSITYTAPAASAGSYELTVAVTDDNGTGTSDSQVVSVSIAPNQLPVISGAADQSVVETQTLTMNLTATDADGPLPISITQTNNLPRGATFTDLGNGQATLTWESLEGDAQANPYVVTVTATDGQGGATVQPVNITVSESAPPTIDEIVDQNVVEGQSLSVAVNATDADGPGAITLTQSNTLPGAAATFTDNGDGTGSFNWNAALGEAGTYSVTITATDEVGKFSTEEFAVTVNIEGVLIASAATAPIQINLTDIGTEDWVKWGFRNSTEIDRKLGVTPLIFNYVPVNGATPVQAGFGQRSRYSWTDGSPTANATESRSGIRSFNNGRGFEFTVQADNDVERDLRIFLGISNATGTVEISLTDDSAPVYSQTFTQGNSRSTREISVAYKSSLPNQSLTVRWIRDSGTGGGWVALEAAVLRGSPSLPFIEDFSDGSAQGWSVVTDTPATPSWSVSNGEYRQDNPLGINTTAMQGANHVGTYSYQLGIGALEDHSVSVVATPLANSGQDFGLMTRVDAANDSYQRLSFNASSGFTRFESKSAGSFTTLARNARGLEKGTSVNLSMQMQGNNSIAYVDGQKLVGAHDPDHDSGSVGLYCRDVCKFDNLVVNEVTSLPTVAIESPMEYNVVGTSTFAVSAVALNVPTSGTVVFSIAELTNACTPASEPDAGHFTASCTVSGQGTYTLMAELRDATGTGLDTHVATNIGVGMQYVTIGDSITNGLDDEFDTDRSSTDGYVENSLGYQPTATQYLNELPAFEPTILHSEGVPGDTSERLLNSRISGLLERHTNATNMIVMIGVNDAGGSLFTPSGEGCNIATTLCDGTFKGNLQGVIDQANLQGITPLIPTTMPRFGDVDAPPYADPVNNSRNLLIRDEYNDVINNELTGRVIGPDFYDLFLGSENRFYLYATNLHPNALGYKLIATELFNQIAGQSMQLYYADNFCVKLSQGGNCETVHTYKQNLLEIDDTLWVDRPYTLTTAPAILDDGRWWLTPDGDLNLSNTDYLTFDVPSATKMYIAYDANASSVPAWLSSGFTNTGQVITTTNPLVPVMNLWESPTVTGTQVLEGAGASGSASSNYLVILVEQ